MIVSCPGCASDVHHLQSGEPCKVCKARSWLPMPGPQTIAMQSRADVLAIGGAVFGGKTTLINLMLARNVTKRNYTGIVFRREAVMFKGAGGLWQKSQEFFPAMGGRPREAPAYDWRFPRGGILSFAGLERLDDWRKHEGNEYVDIVFDEAHQFSGSQILRMMQRNRTPMGYAGHCRTLLTFNPPARSDPGYAFLREQLLPWWIDAEGWPIPDRSGVLRWFTIEENLVAWVGKDWRDADGIGPSSFTFVPMKMDDNPIGVAKNPRYKARLRAQTKVEQQRKLKGNFNAQAGARLFEGAVIRWIDAGEVPDGLQVLRYWDLAATPAERARSGYSATGSARGGHILCPVCAGFRFVVDEPCGFCNADRIAPRYTPAYDDQGDLIEPRPLFILTDATEGYGDPDQVDTWLRDAALRDGVLVPVYIEQEKGSSGARDINATSKHVLPEFEVCADPVTGSKAQRARAVVSCGQQGLLFAVRGPYDAIVSRGVETFGPDGKGEHADVIDATSGCYHANLTHEWPEAWAWKM